MMSLHVPARAEFEILIKMLKPILQKNKTVLIPVYLKVPVLILLKNGFFLKLPDTVTFTNNNSSKVEKNCNRVSHMQAILENNVYVTLILFHFINSGNHILKFPRGFFADFS